MDTRTKSTARRRVEQLYPDSPPGVASRYLRALDELDPCPVVIACRVSSGVQNANGNMVTQTVAMRVALITRGFLVLETFTEIGPGWRRGRELHRPQLVAAIEYAREHGAIVVAESTDRFIRSVDYNGQQNPGAWPTEFDFELLKSLANGVVLATVLPPDAPWDVVRGHQSKRGQRERGRKGGRPRLAKEGDKKAVREKWMPFVLRMADSKLSLADLASITDVPRSTIYSWIKRSRQSV